VCFTVGPIMYGRVHERGHLSWAAAREWEKTIDR
jgi:hypothetical protein